MILIKSTAKTTYEAGQEWLRRQLMIDEIMLKDYERPVKIEKIVKDNPFKTLASARSFAKEVYKSLLL
jgi:hypothetical protein